MKEITKGDDSNSNSFLPAYSFYIDSRQSLF